MVKKSSKQEAEETTVSLSVNGGPSVEVGTIDNFVEKVVNAIPPTKTIGMDLQNSKQWKKVVKHFGEDVANAITNQEDETQLKQGIGNCQAKVSRATDETRDNLKYQQACEVKSDFDGALKEATAGDRAAIALRLLKLSMMRGK